MEDIIKVEKEEINQEDIIPCSEYKDKELERIQYCKV